MNKKNNILHVLLGFVVVSFLVIPEKAEAKIYKCVNKHNKVYYNDKPCPKLDKETEIKNIKDPRASSTSVGVDAPLDVEKGSQKKAEIPNNNKKVTKEFMKQDAQARYDYMHSQEYLERNRKKRK